MSLLIMLTKVKVAPTKNQKHFCERLSIYGEALAGFQILKNQFYDAPIQAVIQNYGTEVLILF